MIAFLSSSETMAVPPTLDRCALPGEDETGCLADFSATTSDGHRKNDRGGRCSTAASSAPRRRRRDVARAARCAAAVVVVASTLAVASGSVAFPAASAQDVSAAGYKSWYNIFVNDDGRATSSRELQKKKGKKKPKKKKGGGGGQGGGLGRQAGGDCPEAPGDNIFAEAGRRELQKKKKKPKKKPKKGVGGGNKKGCPSTPLAVDVVVSLYNGAGLTAQAVMDGEAPPGEGTYKSKIETALDMTWMSKDEWFVAEAGDAANMPALDLSSPPTIVSGVDVACPPEVRPVDPVTGAATICHDFTISIALVKPPALEDAALVSYVNEAYAFGQRDGALTAELDQLFVEPALFVTSGPPPPTPQPSSPPPTAVPTLAPTPVPTTARPTTQSPTKAPSIYVTGTMDVDVVLGLYNAKGYTAQDLINGVTPEESSFSFKGFLEAALGFVWGDKYNRRRALLERGDFEEYVDIEEEEYPAYLKSFEFIDFGALRRKAMEREFNLGPQDERRLGELDLDLVSTNLTSGIDIECPPYVPPGTVSGAVNKCQNITATFTVIALNLLRQDVRDDVKASIDEAQIDGTLTERYNDIDARRIWRVQSAPRGSYSSSGGGDSGGDGGSGSASGGNSTGSPNAGTRSSGGDDDDEIPWAIIGGAVGGAVLCCCCCCAVGGFCYYKRRKGAGGKVEGDNSPPLEQSQSKTDVEEWNGNENDNNGGYDEEGGDYDNF